MKTIDRFFYQKIAEKLNKIRIRRNASYRELSQLTGMSRTALDDFFLGKVRADDNKFEIICNSLQVNPKNIIDLVLEN